VESQFVRQYPGSNGRVCKISPGLVQLACFGQMVLALSDGFSWNAPGAARQSVDEVVPVNNVSGKPEEQGRQVVCPDKDW